LKGRSEFGLRGTVERWSRSRGIHAVFEVPSARGVGESAERGCGILASALLAPAKGETAEPIDVADFQSAAERIASLRHDVQTTNRARGFPIQVPNNLRLPRHTVDSK